VREPSVPSGRWWDGGSGMEAAAPPFPWAAQADTVPRARARDLVW
jgi:hypothetical protein